MRGSFVDMCAAAFDEAYYTISLQLHYDITGIAYKLVHHTQLDNYQEYEIVRRFRYCGYSGGARWYEVGDVVALKEDDDGNVINPVGDENGFISNGKLIRRYSYEWTTHTEVVKL